MLVLRKWCDREKVKRLIYVASSEPVSRDEENKDVWSCSLFLIDGSETHDLCCYRPTKKEAKRAAALGAIDALCQRRRLNPRQSFPGCDSGGGKVAEKTSERGGHSYSAASTSSLEQGNARSPSRSQSHSRNHNHSRSQSHSRSRIHSRSQSRGGGTVILLCPTLVVVVVV